VEEYGQECEEEDGRLARSHVRDDGMVDDVVRRLKALAVAPDRW
jgi:hypothetical protein